MRFALDHTRALDGRSLADVSAPVVPQSSNVGLVGYSHGGNATLVCAGQDGAQIGVLAVVCELADRGYG